MPSLNQLRYALRNALEFTNKPFWDYKSLLRSSRENTDIATVRDFRGSGGGGGGGGDVSQIISRLISVNCALRWQKYSSADSHGHSVL